MSEPFKVPQILNNMYVAVSLEDIVMVFPVTSPCSSSPQHIEDCCAWLRQKLIELNEEQNHIVHQHLEQVSTIYHQARFLPMPSTGIVRMQYYE